MGSNIRHRKSGQTIQVKAELEWRYAYYDDHEKWLAVCPSLHIALQADSLTDLKQDMLESVDSLFRELIKTDRLKVFLKQHGWTTKAPLPANHANSIVDMPIRFKRVEAHDLQEAVC